MLFSSCVSIYTISLTEGNSAVVEADTPFGEENSKRFLQSELINIVDTNKLYRVRYNINNIDSLGDYLSFIDHEILEFRLNQDTLNVFLKTPKDCSVRNIHKSAILFILNSNENLEIVQKDN